MPKTKKKRFAKCVEKYSPVKDERKKVSKFKEECASSQHDSTGNGAAESNLVQGNIELSHYSEFAAKIKTLFLVHMPQDFYHFWDFCKSLDSKSPENALKDTVGLILVGPYDVLTGKLEDKSENECLNHSRCYYDPPEFQTLMQRGDESGYHIGYYRDDPKEDPAFVASNYTKRGSEINIVAENLFGALSVVITSSMKGASKNKKLNLQKLLSSLKTFASNVEIDPSPKTSKLTSRQRKVVAKTFHGAGIVVPIDKNDVGYRPVPENNATLRKIFGKISESNTDEEEGRKNFEPLDELVTLVQFANDECDFGMGLELAIDMFCYGHKNFKNLILNMMPLAYRLLKREEFATIIEKFMEIRHKDE